MARCLDCGKRLFPIINDGRCSSCLGVRERAVAEVRYRAVLATRDRFNARVLPLRAISGAWRGALLGLGYLFFVFLFVAAIAGDAPGGPERGVRYVNWTYVRRWFVLSAVGAGTFLFVCKVGALRAQPGWAVLIPVAVAAGLGAWFGARRAVAYRWDWWLDLDPPEHLAESGGPR